MTDVSPEVLGKLAELIKVTSGTGACSDPAFLQYLKRAAEFIVAVAWPAAAIVCVYFFRPQLTKFIGDVDTVKIFGAEISRKINTQVEQSAKEAQDKTGMSNAPSEGELARGTIVKNLTDDTYIEVIRRKAESLATEYNDVRHSMLPGDGRTRAMEVVFAKMRTIGQAFFPIRFEFMGSASPGKRLMVMATLQVEPDYDLLDWLADRLGAEKPFLQFHTLAAILLAVRGSNASRYFWALKATVEKVSRFKDKFGGDTSRMETLEKIARAFEDLRVAK
jgi:hypothetical protein